VAALKAGQRTEVWCTARKLASEEGAIPADLAERESVFALVKRVRPDLIFHAAGSFSGDLDTDLAINAWSGRWLLDAILGESLSTRVVLVGSAAEYGRVLPHDNPLLESRVLAPVSVYGFTKATQTLLATHYASQRGADVVVARLFNLFAEGMSTRLFVGRMQVQIGEYLRGERQRIETGNLESERDYIDAAEAVNQLRLIAASGRSGQVYHVANGRPVRMRELLARMLGEAGLDMSVVDDHSSHVGRSHDVPVIYANIEKTRSLRADDMATR
jgi:GDP-4-dehydro-6-deoxy-D-mannose reductase